jgi:hypothetical protein
MRFPSFALAVSAVVSLVSTGCSTFGAAYPARPEPTAGAAQADPPPSRVVVHLTITGAAMKTAIDSALPAKGEGTFPMLGSDRKYTWTRDPVQVSFSQGRIVLDAQVHARVLLPLHPLEFPLALHVLAEPIVSSEYALKLQSVDVKVTSTDTRLSIADKVASIYDTIGAAIGDKVKGFTYDLRPMVAGAAERLARPMPLEMGEANACAVLKVLGIEAGPTILADGMEKDLAIVVAPSVVLPCPVDATTAAGPGAAPAPVELPPLANVATLVPGPFTVTIPLAARYEELTKAMSAAFTDGKLFFSKDFPQLYMEKPEIYQSEGKLVLKLHLQGPVHKLGIDANLDGDIFLAGHPAVVDNEISIPDLEPTIETRNFLLSLKAATDGDNIRNQARQALRLDIGDRLEPVKQKLSSQLQFEASGGCFRGDVDRVQVTGVYPHAAYLRIYAEVTGRARATMPCPAGAAAPAAP